MSDPPTTPTLRLHTLRPGAIVPRYQTEHAAGLDLHACPEDGAPIELAPGAIAPVPTGLAIAVPVGFEAQVRPRSGIASKHGVTLPNSPGTIDADYRGEVIVPLINLGRDAFTVEPGMRIAQMVIAPVAKVAIVEVAVRDDLGATERGHAGFGSTGLR